jgi:hypothetical protein
LEIAKFLAKKAVVQNLLNNRFPFQPCKIALFSKDTGFAGETFFQSNLFIVSQKPILTLPQRDEI